MATKQTAIRIPVGILEAIDARRDADNDRTAIIISLLTSALTGEYIKPKESTTQIIGKLTKTVKSLEAAIDELSFQIKKQTRINNEITTHPVVESQLAINHNSFTVDNNEQFDDDDEMEDDTSSNELMANQSIPNDTNDDSDDSEIGNYVSSDYPEFDTD